MRNHPKITKSSEPHPHIFRDIGIIFLSIIIAFYIADSGLIHKVIDYSKALGYLSSFVAGMLFTSVFTAAPAGVALFEIAKDEPILIVAFVGALGALLGDLMLFRFVKNSLREDILVILKKLSKDRFKFLLKLSYLRWLVVLLGGLIIASPLPDELGLMLMGFSKLDSKLFAILSFFFNFLGIALIGYLAWVS